MTEVPSVRLGASRRLLVLTVALLAVLGTVLAGARPAHADESTPPGKAWVRAGHLVPGVGTTRVDLVPASGPTTSISMSPAASYGDVTSYQKIDPGDYTVYVRPQGAGLETQPMLQRAFTVQPGSATSLVVVGTASAPRLVALQDDLTPPAANTGRVRVLPAASNAQTLSIVAANGPTLASGAVLGQATPYASVPAGTWDLDLTGDNGVTTKQQVNVASGSVYTAIVLDSSPGVVIKVITDAAGAAATPQGAAATGEGGMADAISGTSADGSSSPAGAVVLAVSVLALAGVLVRRRRLLSARS